MTALSELRTLLQDDSNMSAYLLNSSGLIQCFLNLATRTKLPRRQYVKEDRQAPHGLTVRYPQVSDNPHHPGLHQEGISGSSRQTRTPPHRFAISGFEMYGKASIIFCWKMLQATGGVKSHQIKSVASLVTK